MLTKKNILITSLIALILVSIATFFVNKTLTENNEEGLALREQLHSHFVFAQSEYDEMWKNFSTMTLFPEAEAPELKPLYKEFVSGEFENTSRLFEKIFESEPESLTDTDFVTELQTQLIKDRELFELNHEKLENLIDQYNTFVKKDHKVTAKVFDFRPRESTDFAIE